MDLLRKRKRRLPTENELIEAANKDRKMTTGRFHGWPL